MDSSRRGAPDKLDFSRFHDLMHPPFTAYCRSMPGGARRHLRLWAEYVALPWIAERTRCKAGWHRWCNGILFGEPIVICRFCATERDA